MKPLDLTTTIQDYWNLFGIIAAITWTPVLGAILCLIIIRRLRGHHERRSPTKEKLLRYPGYSTQKRVIELSESTIEHLFYLVVFALLVTVVFAYLAERSPHIPSTLIGISIFAVPAQIFLVYRLVHLVFKRRDYQLGLSGELFAAEHLNALLHRGYTLTHDFPIPGQNANIDHIAVGPNGIFAIETKAPRKPHNSAPKDAHTIYYDGKTLTREGKNITSDLNQTRRNANALRNWLKDRIAEEIPVLPVLNYVRWSINTVGSKGDVAVIPTVSLADRINTEKVTTLSPDRITQITTLLQDRCRDVDF